jgi:Beta-lactamase
MSASLPGMDPSRVVDDVYDLEKSKALLAQQAPWWKPGTASGYHCDTIGHVVGEVVRRVTGKTLGRFFAEEIAGPLGADYHIGTGPGARSPGLSPHSRITRRTLVMGFPIRWGMGYALCSPFGGLDLAPRVAYWSGNGGSMASFDLDARMSSGYAQNGWIRGPYELD